MSNSQLAALTTGDVARCLDAPPWAVRRLFERGLLPPAKRCGPYRTFTEEDLPKIEQALRRAGYIDEAEEGRAHE